MTFEPILGAFVLSQRLFFGSLLLNLQLNNMYKKMIMENINRYKQNGVCSSKTANKHIDLDCEVWADGIDRGWVRDNSTTKKRDVGVNFRRDDLVQCFLVSDKDEAMGVDSEIANAVVDCNIKLPVNV